MKVGCLTECLTGPVSKLLKSYTSKSKAFYGFTFKIEIQVFFFTHPLFYMTELLVLNLSSIIIRELKQPWRRRQQKLYKFAYLTMKNSIFAHFARAFFIFWHFEDILILSTTLNGLFCRCVDDVSIWWQLFNFVLLCPNSWFQFNSRIVKTNFSSMMTLDNWKMIAETRSYIFRWRSRFRRRGVC